MADLLGDANELGFDALAPSCAPQINAKKRQQHQGVVESNPFGKWDDQRV